MKTRKQKSLGWGVIIAVVVLLVITLSGGKVFGEGQPVQSLRKFMLQPTNDTYHTYGYSEDTFRFYNFIANREQGQRNQVLIAALRAEIEVLKKQIAELVKPVPAEKVEPVPDPNEVSEENLK